MLLYNILLASHLNPCANVQGAEEYAQLSMRVASAVGAAQALAGIAKRALGSAGASDTSVREAQLVRCDLFLDDISLDAALVQPLAASTTSSSTATTTTTGPPVQLVVNWAIDLPGLVAGRDDNFFNIPGASRDLGAPLRLEGTSVLDLAPFTLPGDQTSRGESDSQARNLRNEAAEAAAAVQWRVKVHKLTNVTVNGARLTALGTALGNLRSVSLGGRTTEPTSPSSSSSSSSSFSSSSMGLSLWSQLQASAERALDTSLALAVAQTQVEASENGHELLKPAPLARLFEYKQAAAVGPTRIGEPSEESTLLAWPWVLPGTEAWEEFAAAELALSDWLIYLPWQFQRPPPSTAVAPDVALIGLAGEAVLTGSEAYETAMLGLGSFRQAGKQQPFLALIDAEDSDAEGTRDASSLLPPCVELLAVTVTGEKATSTEVEQQNQELYSQDPPAMAASKFATAAWALSTLSGRSSNHASPQGPGAWFEVEVKWRYRADLRVGSSTSTGSVGFIGAAMPPAPLNVEGRCIYRFDRSLGSTNSRDTDKSRAVELVEYLLSKHRVMAAAVNGIEVESSAVTQWVSRLSTASGASSSSGSGAGSAQALAELASWLQRQSIVNAASSGRFSNGIETSSSSSSSGSSRRRVETGPPSASLGRAKDGSASAPLWRAAQLPETAAGRLTPKSTASSQMLRSPPPRRHWMPPVVDAALSANGTASTSADVAASTAAGAAAARRFELASVAAFLDALHLSTPRSLAALLLAAGWLRPDAQLKGQLDEPWAVGKSAVEALSNAFVTVTARLLADGTLVPVASLQPHSKTSEAGGSSSNRFGSAVQAAARAEGASMAAMTHAVEYTPEGHVLLRWRADLEARPPLGLAGPSLPLTVEGTSLLLLDASAIGAAPDSSASASGTASNVDGDTPVPLVAEHRVLEVAINGQPSLSQVADWAQQWRQGARPSSTTLATAPFKIFEWLTRYTR